jgi:hypothetical protein
VTLQRVKIKNWNKRCVYYIYFSSHSFESFRILKVYFLFSFIMILSVVYSCLLAGNFGKWGRLLTWVAFWLSNLGCSAVTQWWPTFFEPRHTLRVSHGQNRAY